MKAVWTVWMVLPLVAGCVIGGGDDSWRFEDVTALHVEQGAGSVVVQSATSDTTRVEWSGGGMGDGGWPDVVQDAEGRLWIDTDGGIVSGADLYVELGGDAEVSVLLERGDAFIDVDSPRDLFGCVAAGDLAFDVPAGAYDLDLDAGAGAVTVEGVRDDPDSPHRIAACVGAGALRITGH